MNRGGTDRDRAASDHIKNQLEIAVSNWSRFDMCIACTTRQQHSETLSSHMLETTTCFVSHFTPPLEANDTASPYVHDTHFSGTMRGSLWHGPVKHLQP